MNATPLMQQYFAIKEQHPGLLIFFQVGDFYELFFDDAVKASAFLGIALTKRGTHEGKPIPLCGVPVHTVDHYLVKLIKGGFRVALCEQLEVARPGKMVERGVTRVLTPGTLTDLRMLSDKSASYCASLFPVGQMCGALFVELLTGHMFATVFPVDDIVLLEAELGRFSPDEILVPDSKEGVSFEQAIARRGYRTTLCVQALDQQDQFKLWIDRILGDVSVDLVESSEALKASLQQLFLYFSKNQPRALEQCSNLFIYSADDYLLLDVATVRNLELVKNSADGSSEHTLFSLLDRAVTAMGSRTIKKWLTRPLIRRDLVEQRHRAVGFLVENFDVREQMAAFFKEIGDVERVVGRIVLRRAQVYDYRCLTRALRVIPHLKHLLQMRSALGILGRIAESLGGLEEISAYLEHTLNQDPTVHETIASGVNPDLDRLRLLARDGAQALAAFERREQERTGISSLKVTFNKVQGYALEVTKANRELVPDDYERLQTLVNRERYTNPELRLLEDALVTAQHDYEQLEKHLFEEFCAEVEMRSMVLKKTTQLLAQADAILGLSLVAYQERYVCPQVAENQDMVIIEGRHPVVASVLHHAFIPNDTILTDAERTWIITGPNMGGKSTYLRQVALIAIMAQMGSFVPARQAVLPIFDRIFTRIGSADRVADGKSTFLVEMEETAVICNRATPRSLVILDEVGRGTSTYDGLAIAQAVVEYLHTHVCGRALFATHYHELTVLACEYPGIVAYHAASQRTQDGIILLHKIIKGVAEGSFGLEVARGVNLPQAVLIRAEAILGSFKKIER